MLVASTTGCGGGDDEPLSALAAEGRAIYMSVCIACHNADPNKAGGLGPDVADSSRELIEARVIHGEYPPGYTPKSTSSAMPAFPHLADQVDALYAYLQESKTP